MSERAPHDPRDPREQSAGRVSTDAEINLRVVGGFGVALAAVTALALVAVWLLFGAFQRGAAARDPAPPPLGARAPGPPPGPRLQTHPEQDLRAMRAEEERLLSSYGWVDRGQGIARIPIDRAIDLVAERGLPARPAPPAAAEAPR